MAEDLPNCLLLARFNQPLMMALNDIVGDVTQRFGVADWKSLQKVVTWSGMSSTTHEQDVPLHAGW
jgi:hypothetical protein